MKINLYNYRIDKILFEKTRPSKKAPEFPDEIYIDSQTKPLLGELVEYK